MLELFNSYKDAGKLSEALLVGRNIFNRKPDNDEIFDVYYSFLCTLAETLPSIVDRSHFADEASMVLAFYTENAVLNKKKIESHNFECLKNFYMLKDKLQAVSTQVDFDAILAQLRQVDTDIIKDNFTNEQSESYDKLTKDYTDLISIKMRELEYKNNVAYNRKAADSFAMAFKEFCSNEDKYKNQTHLFSLVSKTLFAYDVSRLFNETLIYYNHVYSYIFSKLDDDGKLAITRFSIECERNLR